MKNLLTTLLLAALALQVSAKTVNHAPYTTLLKKYVNDKGLVNYKAMKANQEELNTYLSTLSANPPEKNWSQNEKMAYWINAYNAFTLRLVLDYYPVKSIKDIGSTIQVPFVNTPWQKKFIKIGSNTYKLDEIEHQILRKDFDDPRIHFALVCASMSCPKLRNEAYEAAKLDAQLTDQAKIFLADKSKNQLTPGNVKLSKYFDWYRKDFAKKGNYIDYINQYAPRQISKSENIGNLDYNWSLNEQ